MFTYTINCDDAITLLSLHLILEKDAAKHTPDPKLVPLGQVLMQMLDDLIANTLDRTDIDAAIDEANHLVADRYVFFRIHDTELLKIVSFMDWLCNLFIGEPLKAVKIADALVDGKIHHQYLYAMLGRTPGYEYEIAEDGKSIAFVVEIGRVNPPEDSDE